MSVRIWGKECKGTAGLSTCREMQDGGRLQRNRENKLRWDLGLETDSPSPKLTENPAAKG